MDGKERRRFDGEEKDGAQRKAGQEKRRGERQREREAAHGTAQNAKELTAEWKHTKGGEVLSLLVPPVRMHCVFFLVRSAALSLEHKDGTLDVPGTPGREGTGTAFVCVCMCV